MKRFLCWLGRHDWTGLELTQEERLNLAADLSLGLLFYVGRIYRGEFGKCRRCGYLYLDVFPVKEQRRSEPSEAESHPSLN